MASPQKENGFTPIANEILEKFCNYRISGEEWLVLWTILRKTYGFNKKIDKISLSQFAVITNLKRQTVLRALKKLSSKKIIVIIKKDDTYINSYKFNKDFDEWQVLSKKITVASKKIMTVIKKDNQLSSKKGHTKETIQKKYTKDILSPKDDEEFSFNEKVKKMFSDKNKRMPIIACYWTYKKINYLNKEQYQSGLKRELKPAGLLVGYDIKKIKKVIEWLNNQDFKFTLETVHKYIDENLEELNSKVLTEDDLINNILKK